MKCTYCDSTTTWIDRPGHPEGKEIVHWRKCLVCGHRFETMEVPKEDYDIMKKRAEMFQAMISQKARAEARAKIDEAMGTNELTS
jgi:transcriptional regulator NrdR family protein